MQRVRHLFCFSLFCILARDLERDGLEPTGVQPENTVPFATQNTQNDKPEFLVEWKAPLFYLCFARKPMSSGNLAQNIQPFNR